jgi:hypothetical protein
MSDKRKDWVSVNEPPPLRTTGDIWKLVIKDMKDRREMGIKKYGVPLQTNNGRDALIDAYQELLDLLVYLRQEIEERFEKNKE